jgi:hypothetical protein
VIRKKTARTATAVAATMAFMSAAVITATPASAWWPFDAQGPNIQKFGTRADVVDGGGSVVQGWTVYDLKASTDAIPYQVQGRQDLLIWVR